METRLSHGNPTTLERTLRLLSQNPFVQALQGLPQPVNEFCNMIMAAAKRQRALIGDVRARVYIVTNEAYELAQLGLKYWTDCNLQRLAITPSGQSHPTDGEPRTFLEEGGLAVVVVGVGSDTSVLAHSGPNGVRTQYDSGGY